MHKGLRENKDYNEKKKTRDLIDKKCIEKKYNLGSLACPDKDNWRENKGEIYKGDRERVGGRGMHTGEREKMGDIRGGGGNPLQWCKISNLVLVFHTMWLKVTKSTLSHRRLWYIQQNTIITQLMTCSRPMGYWSASASDCHANFPLEPQYKNQQTSKGNTGIHPQQYPIRTQEMLVYTTTMTSSLTDAMPLGTACDWLEMWWTDLGNQWGWE